MEGALEKLLLSGGVSSELQGVCEQLDFLNDISRQIIDEFKTFLDINRIQFTIQKVTFALEELQRELAKREV